MVWAYFSLIGYDPKVSHLLAGIALSIADDMKGLWVWWCGFELKHHERLARTFTKQSLHLVWKIKKFKADRLSIMTFTYYFTVLVFYFMDTQPCEMLWNVKKWYIQYALPHPWGSFFELFYWCCSFQKYIYAVYSVLINTKYAVYTVKSQCHILLTKVQISWGPELILHGDFQQPHVAVNCFTLQHAAVEKDTCIFMSRKWRDLFTV